MQLSSVFIHVLLSGTDVLLLSSLTAIDMIVNRFRTAAVLIGYPVRKRGKSVLTANLMAAGISDAAGVQGCSRQK
jgi:hypothetical protein